MPTGVLHLKEVDTDEITLDGTLSVSGASTLEGATVAHSTLSVGGAATLADANAANVNAANVNVSGTLSVAGQTTMGGNIIPDTNDAYDIGSPEFKIRDLYVSDNSIWVGDDMKISNDGGKLKFRKRKTNVVPRAILDAGANAGHANEQATADAALAHAGVANVSDMKLQHWFKFMRTLNSLAKITDIFRDTDDDYEESSASDAWKEISGTNKIYTNSVVGVGTSDPDDTLHVKGSFKVESDTGFQLIRSTVGADDPQLIIDTKQFGVDETIEDLTGQGLSKFTKLYRVYGTNSEGYGRDWYWGLANDDYTNISLAVGGESGGNDPDLAFTFTTASELHCNKVYAALGGNADTATRLATPRKINGVDFDGTQDITIAADGITSLNGNIGIGTTSPQQKLEVHGNILLGQNNVDSFIHGGSDIAMSSDTHVLIVSDANDITSGASGDIIFGAGSAINMDTSRNFTYAQAYPSGLPRLEHMRIKASGNIGIGTDNPLNLLHLSSDNSSLDASGSATFEKYSLIIHNTRGSGANGTELGLCFNHYDTHYPSSTGTPGAAITHERTDTWSRGKLHFKTKSGGSENGSCDTRMTIDSAGNVGVGTTSPQHKLEVGNGDIAIVNNSWKTTGNDNQLAGKLLFYVGGNNNERATPVASIEGYDKYTGGNYAGAMALKAHGNEVMRLMSDGSVGIGTTSPDSTLHVNGNALIGNVPAYGKYTDAQLTLGGAHNTTTNYNNDSQIKLLISKP